MLEESGKMITDSANRLGVVVQELRELIVSATALEGNPRRASC